MFRLILYLAYLTVCLKEKEKRDTKQKMILLSYVTTVLISKPEQFHFTWEEGGDDLLYLVYHVCADH